MARIINKLSALQVARIEDSGMYSDGGGLYLQVIAKETKSWIFRFMLNGRAREMGLGPLHTVSLAEARARATDCRQRLQNGEDPIEARRSEKAKAQLEAAKAITFKVAAAEYIKNHRAGWRNAKHVAQWESTLATYAEPVIGKQPVQMVDTALVIRILQPLWSKKPETASRLRGRIEGILDWARVQGYREGENPARWRGHLDKILPARSKMSRVKHHAAIPYAEIGEFMTALRALEGTAARAFEFAILTAARTGEVIGARWSEINLADKVWIIPAERMKAGKEHRVPLAPRALAILAEMTPLRRAAEDEGAAFIFPGRKDGQPLSNMAFLMLLRRMERSDLTAHGFRSSFRDWAAESTNFPSEVAEMALAHTVGDKVEAAYRRTDLFQRRKRLMQEWAQFCELPSATGARVIKFKG